MSLLSRWLASAGSVRLGVREALTQWWRVIEDRYTEKQRHYHSLQHVLDMFVLWDGHRERLEGERCVAMAIVFHESVLLHKEQSD